MLNCFTAYSQVVPWVEGIHNPSNDFRDFAESLDNLQRDELRRSPDQMPAQPQLISDGFLAGSPD